MNEQEIKLVIAARFRAAREQAGLSQGQLAKRLTWHRPTISAIEAGERSIAAEELPVFADLFGVSVAWLTGADNSTASESTAAQDAKIALAARGLSKISTDDLDNLMALLKNLRAGR